MKCKANHNRKSILSSHIYQFIQYKRTLGRKYETEELTLRLLENYMASRRINSFKQLTPELIQDFLLSRPRSRPRSYNHLLGVVREFFRWLVSRQTVDRSPVVMHPRRGSKTRIPVILMPKDIQRLLELTGSLSDKYGGKLRASTYQTIFTLLYSLGLRVGEVCRLKVEDIQWDRQLLIIRNTKFGKSRLVPFGPRLCKILQNYLELRSKKTGPLSGNSSVFSVHGKLPVKRQAIGKVLRQLAPKIGFSKSKGIGSPRVHDLRHSFAVTALLRWYHAGINPSDRLLHLSTFLGHVSVESTSIYLTITTELLEVASKKYEQFAKPILPEVYL